MSNLKDLTWEHHKNAERQAFVKEMFSGNLEPKKYAYFLFQQHAIYDALEAMAMMHGLFNDMPEIRRGPKILEDAQELWPLKIGTPELCNTTKEYGKYLLSIMEDKDKIMAHVYVRHMGDLAGGQMIAKKVPGAGRMYQFDRDHMELKEAVRAKLNDDMAEEAKVCFDFATKLFQELENVQL